MIEVLFWLSKVDGIGPLRIKHIINEVGDEEVLWNASFDRLSAYKSVTNKQARNLINSRNKSEIADEVKRIKCMGISMIGLNDPFYPQQLKEIHDPPPIIYTKGNKGLLNVDYKKLVGVVGTRKPTAYGCKLTKDISAALSNEEVVIVSGMALGVDEIAHQSCKENNYKTIAVLGCGCDVVYPKSNRHIYEGILQNEGLLLSEFPPHTQPLRHHFPRRNRIISGLSSGIVVVEASDRSGSLITAKFANEQGRHVMCVPGNVTNPMSKGSFKLIKEGAVPVASAKDIMDELEIEMKMTLVSEKNIHTTLEKSLAFIEPATADQISALLDTDVYDIMLQLTLLEVKGKVKRLPGGLFVCS